MIRLTNGLRGDEPVELLSCQPIARQESTSRERVVVERLTHVVALLLIFAIPTLCWADRWYEDYEQAVTLIGEGECSREALRLLGAAVVDKPRPRMNARTIAVKNIDYLPYYQLARAHLACGEAGSSRHYLDISRNRGVAPTDLLDGLEERLIDFEAESKEDAGPDIDPVVLAARVRVVNDTIRRARTLAAQIERGRGDRRFASFFETNSALLSRAAGDLSGAEEQLADGTLRRELEVIDAASTPASSALQTYSELADRMAALPEITPTFTPTLVPPTRTVSASPTATRPQSLPAPTATRPIAETVPPPDVVSASLRRAAAAYLRTSYTEAINSLSPEDLSKERERAAAYLLRAAAHFALYCLGGREDGEALETARRDLQRSHEIDPSLTPDSRVFSPEFVALFQGL